MYLSNEEFEYQHSDLVQKGAAPSAVTNPPLVEHPAVDISGLESQLAEITSQFRSMAATLDKVAATGKVAAREQKRTRRDLALVAMQAQFTDLGITAMLCALCVGTVGAIKIGVELRASIQENAPPWLVAMIYPGLQASNGVGSGEFASPIVGKTLQELVDYQPSHGQSFGPETGNMRSYGPHGGVDFDCRVGGCAGADIASPIKGTVISIRQIGTSANGGSFQVDIDGEDWAGAVTHQLVHVDSVSVKIGDTVKAGQVVAKVSPTDTVSTGPHFDWKVRRNGQWVNPQKWAATAIEKNATRGGGGGNADAVELIKGFENFHPTPYWDFQQWTWGYGTKAPGQNGTIDRARAEQEVNAYLDRHCLPLIEPMDLTLKQEVATLSLCFNIGPGQFQESEVFLYASQGDHQNAANAFMNWTKAGGEVLPGLVTRRQKEKAIYLEGS